MSIGIILMGVLEFLPLEVKNDSHFNENRRFLIGRITIHPRQLPATRTDVPGMHRADFVSPGNASVL